MLRIAVVLGVFAVFFVHGAWPAPDYNEAHYLIKAKHFWDPDWCSGDLFVESSGSTHLIFYLTFGSITQWLSLEAAAWLGRIASWLLVAWGWMRLCDVIVPRSPFVTILSAGLFTLLQESFAMAGETIICGVEAKVFAYGVVFIGLAEFLKRGRLTAFPIFGAATAVHVLVGGWTTLACGAAWLIGGRSTAWRPSLAAVVLTAAFGAVGVVPALSPTDSSPPSVVQEAHQIYVYNRLGHHLDPGQFPKSRIRRHCVLLAAWTCLAAAAMRVSPRSSTKRLALVVAAAEIISIAGFAMFAMTDYRSELQAGLLRYYWFRLADVFLPMGFVLLGCRVFFQFRRWASASAHVYASFTFLLIGVHLAFEAAPKLASLKPRTSQHESVESWLDWKEACGWVAVHTELEAQFLTPRLSSTFQWYSHRAAVVDWKNIPQSPPAIVEWWRRYRTLHLPQERRLSDLSFAELERLGRELNADYAILHSSNVNAPDRRQVFQNDHYTVVNLQ